MASEKPTIDVMEDAPLIVKGLDKLTDAENQPIPMEKGVIALCRCGKSSEKPFCDGTHSKIGFSGAREQTEDGDVREYEGKEITVVDDVSICCHAGACAEGAEAVFFSEEGDERVSTPDEGTVEQIIATIRKCPSGSLAYKLKDKLHDIYFSGPEIQVTKDGPLEIRGGIELNNPEGPAPRTTDHYTLCRCGASKNHPFCDGSHNDMGFSDED